MFVSVCFGGRWFIVEVLVVDSQYVHCKVHNLVDDSKWCLTVVYGIYVIQETNVLWRGLAAIAKPVNYPWLIGEHSVIKLIVSLVVEVLLQFCCSLGRRYKYSSFSL
ncbi:hypothetical protein Ancab_005491 [Ancistrocladus abbreviatus]